MCFSAGANFATATGTGAIGILALSRTKGPQESPLAAIPFVFAIQQSAEGFIFAVSLVEEDRKRRLTQWALLGLALPVSAYGLLELSAHPYNVCVLRHSLSYENGVPYPTAAMAAYVASTCLPFILSSHRTLRWFGLIVVTGLIIASIFYYSAFVSVWCFFAAIASIAVHIHFLPVRRPKPIELAADQP